MRDVSQLTNTPLAILWEGNSVNQNLFVSQKESSSQCPRITLEAPPTNLLFPGTRSQVHGPHPRLCFRGIQAKMPRNKILI